MLPALWSSVDEEYCHWREGVLGRMVGSAGVGSGEGDGADGMRLWRGEALLSGCLFADQLAERGGTQRAVFLASRLPLREIWGRVFRIREVRCGGLDVCLGCAGCL